MRNVGTFKDFILSSKHSEGTEGYEREFYTEMVLGRCSLKTFSLSQKSGILLAQHRSLRHRERIVKAFCSGLNDPGSDLENDRLGSLRLQYEGRELPTDGDAPARRGGDLVAGQPVNRG